jgi:DNA-directed RNA polymerase specialized sigma24 family protein
LLTIAKNITKGRDAADLLHNTFISLCGNHTEAHANFEYVVIRALYLHNIKRHRDESTRRKYVQTVEHERLCREVDQLYIYDLGTEVVDAAIRLIPDTFTRMVFEQYAIVGFSYEELHRETGIPIDYLYEEVRRAKRELKKIIKKA